MSQHKSATRLTHPYVRLNPTHESRSMLDMKTLLTLLIFLGSASAGEFDSLTAYPVSRVVDDDTVVLLVDGAPVKVRLIRVSRLHCSFSLSVWEGFRA